MIFYYKIDFVSVADIAFKINHVGSYGVANAPISARSLWSHAWTLARLMPRSLSLHLGFRLDVALPFAPLAHSLCSYARPHALGGHAGYVVSLFLHYPHAPRGRTRDIPCLLPFAFLRPTYNLYRVAYTPKSHMD